jgi:serine/threonine-protein kinase
MGEVYLARDTKLDRDVAIKVLPDALATDPDRIARFQREAKTLAALNHPHIAAIHGLEDADGIKALVMELVEGPTLADRIAQGAIPLDEALPFAKQIAEALEAAHEQGIIHRDLKPANIKVRPDGTVKVLDFGLAKAMEPGSAMSASASMSPTITTPAMTQAGMILGTAAYMSPEQARGKPVDKRADIWAFGCVLYEMLTGRRAFEAEDVSLTLAEVMKSEPDMDALPGGTPAGVRQALRLCLQKNPRQRGGDIAAIRLVLEGAFETTTPQVAASAAVSPPVTRRALPVAAAFFAGGLVVGISAWSLWPAAERRVTRLAMNQPADQPLALGTQSPDVALSPDGTRTAYTITVDGRAALAVRSLDALDATVVYEGTSNAPFFSPDGAWIGFNDQVDDTIKRVAVTGGPALTVGEVGAPRMAGAAWSEDGTIIFGTNTSGLWRVPVGGGKLEALTTLDEAQGESSHEWPELLPGGNAVLFAITREARALPQIAVRDLRSGDQRVLISGGSYPKYSPTGHIVYGVEGTLRAVPFDVDRLQVTGNPAPVVDGVVTKLSGAADFAVARDGSLVYVAGAAQSATGNRSLVWVDSTGRVEPLPTPGGDFEAVSLSPDGTRAMIGIGATAGNADVWLSDLARGTLTRITTDPAFDGSPLWSPDGRRVAYASNRSGRMEVLWQAADGSGSVETLVTFPEGTTRVVPSGWSPDGKMLFVAAGPQDQALDIGIVTVGDPKSWRVLLQTPADERNPTISPNGRWLAYASRESGNYEVYIQRFPDGGGRQQVSVGGGHSPRWGADGRTLTYARAAIAAPIALTRVPVSGGESERVPITFGRPADLFPYNYFSQQGGQWWFDMASNGGRFLMISGGVLGADASIAPQLIVVQNFFEELKRLVPPD